MERQRNFCAILFSHGRTTKDIWIKMDREGSNLPENQDNDSQISPSPSDQTTDDGASKGIRAIPEQRKDATVCSDCLPQPSNETPTEDSCIHSSPLQSSSDSKKSKFACQSASSQVHSKNTEGIYEVQQPHFSAEM
ncbi:uncharacterized protein LOC122559207 isoform X4 [Chiloscyllium plagiosum]|uniref:uncharacterized protein LOC122559207 isoform X4 n=1 Tax=Chiloscyllium plagiosum TaxID=36176 RepID=UPI001CB809EF|nr:uncharacterized protein LOC122559207 isoform X4 [Chiloscyllium plagiosum]